jgi:hypothetical protein
MSLVTDQSPGPFLIRECLDSPKRAESCRKALDIPSIEAIRLGMKAIADWPRSGASWGRSGRCSGREQWDG